MLTWKSVWIATSATAIIDEFSGLRIVPRAIAVSMRRLLRAGASGALLAALSGAAMSKTISGHCVTQCGGGGAQPVEPISPAAVRVSERAGAGHRVRRVGRRPYDRRDDVGRRRDRRLPAVVADAARVPDARERAARQRADRGGHTSRPP